MKFELKESFSYWLKVNGYAQEDIQVISDKWESVTIINGQITDSVTINNINEIPNNDE